MCTLNSTTPYPRAFIIFPLKSLLGSHCSHTIKHQDMLNLSATYLLKFFSPFHLHCHCLRSGCSLLSPGLFQNTPPEFPCLDSCIYRIYLPHCCTKKDVWLFFPCLNIFNGFIQEVPRSDPYLFSIPIHHFSYPLVLHLLLQSPKLLVLPGYFVPLNMLLHWCGFVMGYITWYSD